MRAEREKKPHLQDGGRDGLGQWKWGWLYGIGRSQNDIGSSLLFPPSLFCVGPETMSHAMELDWKRKVAQIAMPANMNPTDSAIIIIFN